MRKLALHGGEPVCAQRIDPTRHRPLRFDNAEKDALLRVVHSGALCRTFGTEADLFELETARFFDSPYAVAASSGTAAIHTALAAVGTGWQDEVITSPITDIGSIIGIVAQGARPVFADLDHRTYNMTPESVGMALTGRTKAILVVHLAGLSCEIEAICELARGHGASVVEDCAQSWLARYKGRPVGTFGQVGCFSLNGYKHISTGDGGVAITADSELARRMRLFVDKAYDRQKEVRNPEVFAMNYRMTELQAAVGREQLKKLGSIIGRRREIARRLLVTLADVPGLLLPVEPEGFSHSWWYFVIRADRERVRSSTAEITRALAAEGLPAWTGYCGGQPVYLYDCFTDRSKAFFKLPPLAPGTNDFPSGLYPRGLCPVAERVVGEMIIISMSEFYAEQEVENIAGGIRKVFTWYASQK
ncbi:MAG TPA: DegT/DnrJ/EryC1/StrS family aminotransferase [archaeon]|nr:DegT/DnrJ/EryC1/StrS family aminotransferase [archaeon]